MKTIFAACLLVVLALFSGCTQTASNSGVVQTPQIDDSHPSILVIYGNKELNGNVVVNRKVFDNAGPLSKCSVTIQNVTQNTYILEYRFEWKEASGMPVMQTAAWSRLILSPNMAKSVISMGKTPEAKQVEMLLRLPMTELYEPAPKKK